MSDDYNSLNCLTNTCIDDLEILFRQRARIMLDKMQTKIILAHIDEIKRLFGTCTREEIYDGEKWISNEVKCD